MFWYLFLVASPILLMPIVSGYYKVRVDDDPKAKKTFLFWCGLILFLIIALRHKDLGSVDSANYYDNWIRMREMSVAYLPNFLEESDMESGYLLSVWLLSRVFPNPQFVFVFSGLVFSFAVCRVIYLNSEDSMLSMVMYICLGLYTFMIQGLRQSIAISICLLAIESCKKRKLIRFLLLIFIAFLFHRTCVIFLLVYPFYGLKFDLKSKAIMLASAVVLILLSPTFIRYGNDFLDKEYTTVATSGALIATAVYFIIIAVAFFFLNEKNTDQNTVFFAFITVVGAALYAARYIGAQVMDRISFYFLIGQSILLPAVIAKFDEKSRQMIKTAVCILCTLLFIYRLNTSYGTEYIFFWQ